MKPFEWNEELSTHEQQRREVFARFGLAVYFSQCLEKQVGIMLSSMYNEIFLQVQSDHRDELFDENISKTLGQMVKALKDRGCLTVSLEARLRDAVKMRNWLAHQYFFERDKSILTSSGCEKMIEELREKADSLKKLDDELVSMLKRWLEEKGVAEEEIKSEMDNYLAKENGDCN